VFGGGHRSDVIKNMTMEEWKERKIEETSAGEQVTTSNINSGMYYKGFDLRS
jgi:hypothetical protein